MTDQQEQLNGAQVQAVQRASQEAVRRFLADIELRKWTFDQVRQALHATGANEKDFIGLTNAVYGFVTAGLQPPSA